MGTIIERAKRIHRIRLARKTWESAFIWRNHTTASHEFQLLDVLRDIRLILSLILLTMVMTMCQSRHDIVVRVNDAPEVVV